MAARYRPDVSETEPSAHYEITVQGILEPRWSAWFDGLAGSAGQSRVGGVQPAFELGWLAGPDRLDRPQRTQPRPGPDLLVGQGGQPPGHRRRLSPGQRGPEVPLHQPGGPRGIPGGQRVPDGVIDQPLLLAPA